MTESLMNANGPVLQLGAELQLERMTAPVREALLTYGLGADLQPIHAGERA